MSFINRILHVNMNAWVHSGYWEMFPSIVFKITYHTEYDFDIKYSLKKIYSIV